MTEEQKKVRKFYKDFQGWKMDIIGTWIGAGFLVLLMVIGCAVPAQEMFSIATGEADMLMWMMVLMFGPLAGFLYLRPYTSVTETVYTNSPKNVRIIDKLKYLPISLKEIRKMKVIYLLEFYAKIAPFCMGLQILTSLYSYGEITWKNVLFILIMAFAWPVLVNLPMILSEREMEIPVSRTLSKYGKWIVALLIVLGVVVYMFFPRNLKDLLLDGADEKTVTIMVNDVTGEEFQNYELKGEQREALLTLLEENYVRVNPVHKSYISEHYVGIFISVAGVEDMMYIFSEEIISFGGTQYLLYGDSFVEEFREIFANE